MFWFITGKGTVAAAITWRCCPVKDPYLQLEYYEYCFINDYIKTEYSSIDNVSKRGESNLIQLKFVF